jgi:hypothetical protein
MGYTRNIDISAAAGIKNKKTFVLSIEMLCGLILLGDIILNLLLCTFYLLFYFFNTAYYYGDWAKGPIPVYSKNQLLISFQQLNLQPFEQLPPVSLILQRLPERHH